MKPTPRESLVLATLLFLLPSLGMAQAVPAPEAVLGYEVGERFTDAAGVERYMRALADASDRVTVDSYGTTSEGRPLVQVLFALPRHRTRLDEILGMNRELADPETSEVRAAEISASNPAIVYLTYGVHGDESASSEAAIWTAYDLASGSGALAGVLDSVVVVMDPVANPDGRDRYVNWFRQAAQARPNPNPELRERRQPWPGGRFNHYLFDLNRDWAWLTQIETRGRLERYHRYLPQVHVDFHEMGSGSTYFFFPAADPINTIIPSHVLEWGERFGQANAAAMDREGLLYYTGQNYDLFYPGYGDSWPSLLGAIGMTYEQGGGGAAGTEIERPDGSVLTLRDRAFGHRTTGNATLRAAADGKTDLLLGFAALHRAVDSGLSDVYLIPGPDPSRAEALVSLLREQGIEVERAEEDVPAESIPHVGFQSREVLPLGSYRVRARQPRGLLAGALLRPDNSLDASSAYDITAWALPYAYGVEAHSALRPAGGNWAPVATRSESAPGGAGAGSYGSLMPPSFSNVPGLIRFLEAEGRVVALADTFSVAGTSFPRGTLFFPRSRNEGLDERLAAAGLAGVAIPISSGLTISGPDLGTDDAAPLTLPRIGLLGGEGTSPTGFGAHWHFLERVLDIPFDILAVEGLSGVALDDYDVIVVPPGSPESVLGESGIERLDSWIRAGGTLVAAGAAARDLAEPLAEVVERTELEEEVDPDRDERLERALRTREERELDRWREETPGTIFQLTLDPAHPLAFGADAGSLAGRFFVLSSGVGFEPDEAFESVAYFPEGLDRISGVVSDETLDRLARSAWLVERTRGSGKVILFADDPLFRGFWYSGFQIFANAILVAPAF
ncbi:MAG: M14 family metallopeptidase [Gemmatimonadota bacterium]